MRYNSTRASWRGGEGQRWDGQSRRETIADIPHSVAGDLTVVEALRAAATLQSKESSDAASLQAASLTGETYERLASLSFRQTLAANKLAWYDGAFNVSYSPSTAHLWVKGCGSSGDTGDACKGLSEGLLI